MWNNIGNRGIFFFLCIFMLFSGDIKTRKDIIISTLYLKPIPKASTELFDDFLERILYRIHVIRFVGASTIGMNDRIKTSILQSVHSLFPIYKNATLCDHVIHNMHEVFSIVWNANLKQYQINSKCG